MVLTEIEKVIEHPNRTFDRPIVSVCITAYNHEAYITQCLEGVLMQKTNFDYEILLGEDESKDNSREICIKYATKYPGKIKLFLHSRANTIHIDGRPTGRFPFLWNLQHAKGKYIALLDGDDYWTDPYKLQKQVDFLENNPDYTICYHNVDILQENMINKEDRLNLPQDTTLSITDLTEKNIIHTPSVMYRKLYSELPNWFRHCTVGDYPLHLLHAEKGKIFGMSQHMAVYRSGVGIWSQQKEDEILNKWTNLLYYLSDKFEDKTNDGLLKSLLEYKKRMVFNEFPQLRRIENHLKRKEQNEFYFQRISSLTYLDLLKLAIKKLMGS